jgi:hypothetical protein
VKHGPAAALPQPAQPFDEAEWTFRIEQTCSREGMFRSPLYIDRDEAAPGATVEQIDAADQRSLAAERLADEGRLDATTLARQERLLDRLLSAGRTLEREGDTEEREGTPAGPVERSAVDPLSRALLTGLAVPLPTAAELESLSPGERRMVLEYFERMNRRRAGGGDP